jgi:hypothetical protein
LDLGLGYLLALGLESDWVLELASGWALGLVSAWVWELGQELGSDWVLVLE